MAYKPSDFFVGAVDLFAVMMPGAVFTAVASSFLPDKLFGIDLPATTNTAAFWVTFVVSCYLFGHLLFAIGSILDSLIYDPIRKRLVPREKDDAYNIATQLADNELGEYKPAMNTFQYCRSVLDFNDPGAASLIRRLEADSKFFRSISVVFVFALFLPLVREVPIWHVLVLLMLLVASLCRYGLRRFKSAELAYRYFVAKRMSEKYDANNRVNRSGESG
jgi:hypothetical protein